MKLKHHSKRLYRILTVSTKRRAYYAVLGSLLFFYVATMGLAGIALGADAAFRGDSLGSILAAINASRFELWMDFADGSPLAKSVFGLLYPVIAVAWVVAIAGLHLGYAVPELGYLISGLNVLWPVVGIGLIVLQFIRFIDLYRK